MGSYVARRLLLAVPVLLGISILGFAVLSLAPGDPVLARIDPQVLAQLTPEQIALRRHELGFDQPIPVRYIRWLAGVLQGDLGYSIISRQAVADMIVARLPATLILMGTALLIAVGIAVPFGVLSALRARGPVDYVLSALAVTAISAPPFVVGLVFIYSFGVALRLLPVGGITTLGRPFSVPDLLAHLIMPATVVALAQTALLMRATRSTMLEVLGSEYITAARAKGLSGYTVITRHALRNVLIPVVTLVGLFVPELFAGAIITEQVFAWPGLGQLAVSAAADRDPALAMGTMMLVAVAVVASNLITDVAYAVVDPRIRYGRGP